MQWWRNAQTLWNLLFAAGDVWTVARWTQRDGLTMGVSLGVPEYAALLTVFTGGLIAVNWRFVKSRLPSVRFAQNYRFIARCRDNVGLCIEVESGAFDEMAPGATARLRSSLSELANTLNKFSVPCPSDDTSLIEWFQFLRRLAPLSRTRDLKAARRLVNPRGRV